MKFILSFLLIVQWTNLWISVPDLSLTLLYKINYVDTDSTLFEKNKESTNNTSKDKCYCITQLLYTVNIFRYIEVI